MTTAIVYLAICIGAFLDMFDGCVANVSVSYITQTFNSFPDSASWIITSYFATTIVGLGMTRWLSSRVLPITLFQMSLLAFLVCSIGCGLSRSLRELVCFRFLQGYAGALLQPLSQVLLLKVSGSNQLARALFFQTTALTLGFIAGPAIGGLIVDHLGWRMVFLITVPLNVTSLIICCTSATIKHSCYHEIINVGKISFFGGISMGCGALILTIAAQLSIKPSLSSESLFAASIIGVALTVFGLNRGTQYVDMTKTKGSFRSGFLNFRLLQAFLMGFVAFGTTFLIPFGMESFGYSANTAGLALLPSGLAVLIGAWFTRMLGDKAGDIRVVVFGVFLCLISYYIIITYNGMCNTRTMVVSMILWGFGMVFISTSTTLIVFKRCPDRFKDDVVFLSFFFRFLGGTLSIPLIMLLLLQEYGSPKALMNHNMFFSVYESSYNDDDLTVFTFFGNGGALFEGAVPTNPKDVRVPINRISRSSVRNVLRALSMMYVAILFSSLMVFKDRHSGVISL